MKRLSPFGSYTLLCIASLTIMVGSVIAPGLLSIATALGVTHSPVWLITLPALGAVIFAPIAGKIIDKYGAYSALTFGLILYGAFGIALFWLQSTVLIFLDRLLLGAATALVMASGTVLISQWYVGQQRLAMMAKQGMAIELGGVIFLFLGGQLAAAHWGLPLSLYLLAWLFLAMLYLFVPKNPPSLQQPTKDVQQHSTTSITGLSLSGVLICATLAMVIFFTSTVLLPISMAEQGYNEQQTGYLLAFISLVAVLSAHFLPKLEPKFGETPLLASAFIFYAFAYFCFSFEAATWLLVLGAICAGIGFGFTIPLLNHMTVLRSKENVRGRNLSYFTMAVFSGQFLTSFIEFIEGGSHVVFLLCSVSAAIIAIVLFVFNNVNKAKSNVANSL
ncbi:MFS transporter [Pseudoalteromonas sp. MMG010]|uniref:MFS transporter n=1 Tax=Pseudoalteromonas sp. MMG010 TaxID=2822685 RepID=UPI001B3A3131|nr:MFS transporter [Pseudoalteromonas sp. MMG010]MBQ4832032.1 MFS transporter [Pseudoalteromonas sp. MMG010]